MLVRGCQPRSPSLFHMTWLPRFVGTCARSRSRCATSATARSVTTFSIHCWGRKRLGGDLAAVAAARHPRLRRLVYAEYSWCARRAALTFWRWTLRRWTQWLRAVSASSPRPFHPIWRGMACAPHALAVRLAGRAHELDAASPGWAVDGDHVLHLPGC